MAASDTTALDPDGLIEHAVSAVLADREKLRSILTDLMTTTLELSAKATWESEDNCTFTEGAVGMLGPFLPDVTAHQAAEICEHFGLEFDEIDRTRYPEPAWATPDANDRDAERIGREAPYREKDRDELIRLLTGAESLLDTLRGEPPEQWAGDDCFEVTYGLAEVLDVPLPSSPDDDTAAR